MAAPNRRPWVLVGCRRVIWAREVHGAFSHHFQPKQAPRMVAEAAGDRVKEPRALQSGRSGDLEGVGTKQAL